jgi:DNA-binding MarR family transcriptional regulator
MSRIEGYVRELSLRSAMHPESWQNLDLTMTQLKALLFIRVRQPLSVGKVAAALGMSLASGSALVDRLARHGLVSRCENPADRRQIMVELSNEGRALLAGLDDQAAARLRKGLSRMSERGLESLEFALAEMVHALSEEEE